jgi:SAM-dependent methyltransferase
VSALDRWRELLPGWGVPDRILADAPESPWGYPRDLMRRRARTAAAVEPSIATRRALEALPEAGSVLDVGVGGGAASLPLFPGAALVTGVDESEGMLAAFRQAAAAAKVHAVHGRWPDVADDLDPADVVVCHHVLFNVGTSSPFVPRARRARARRVVIEITDHHPPAWMNDLWLRFHDLRPDGPQSPMPPRRRRLSSGTRSGTRSRCAGRGRAG